MGNQQIGRDTRKQRQPRVELVTQVQAQPGQVVYIRTRVGENHRVLIQLRLQEPPPLVPMRAQPQTHGQQPFVLIDLAADRKGRVERPAPRPERHVVETDLVAPDPQVE